MTSLPLMNSDLLNGTYPGGFAVSGFAETLLGGGIDPKSLFFFSSFLSILNIYYNPTAVMASITKFRLIL